MIELLYPVETARVIGDREQSGEMVPVVDSVGRVLAQASKARCHDYADPLLHPLVRLQVIDRYSKFYLHRRSGRRSKFPLRWDAAVAGHVLYGEYFEEALYRKAFEQVRLRDFNPTLIDNYRLPGDCPVDAMVNLYLAVGSYPFIADNYEVCEGRWWTMEEIERALDTDTFTPAFEWEFRYYKDKFLAFL